MNNMEITYLPTFYHDLLSITVYIKDVLLNPAAASKLVQNVEQAILEEAKHPGITEPYRGYHNTDNTYYRIHVGNYYVFYTIEDSSMVVCRLIYSRRNLPI